MKTRQQFEDEFGDELRGFVARAFSEAERTQFTKHAACGAFLTKQMRDATELMNRMFRFFQEEPKSITTNGKDTRTESAPVRSSGGQSRP